jgi:hypothetical protein
VCSQPTGTAFDEQIPLVPRGEYVIAVTCHLAVHIRHRERGQPEFSKILPAGFNATFLH